MLIFFILDTKFKLFYVKLNNYRIFYPDLRILYLLHSKERKL
jgi:hypothetical protein